MHIECADRSGSPHCQLAREKQMIHKAICN